MLSPFGSSSVVANQRTNEPAVVRLSIHVLDIDAHAGSAKVKIYAEVNEYPLNLQNISVWIGGSGWVEIPCQNMDPNLPYTWSYKGESEEIMWYLIGTGEMFPWDTYSLNFTLISYILDGNASLHKGSTALFIGAKQRLLNDQWNENLHIKNNAAIFDIRRTDNAILIAILQFLVPIIACYYLLGATVIIDPIEELRNRLTVYLSLFIFSSTFIFYINDFLPYRSSLSFPELLLVTLLVSNAIMSFFSIIGSGKGKATLPYKRKKAIMNTDRWGTILSLLAFLVIYLYTMLGKFKWMNAILIWLIVPAYLCGFGSYKLAMIPRKNWLKVIFRNRGVMVFIIFYSFLLILLVILELAMWWLYGTWIPLF